MSAIGAQLPTDDTRAHQSVIGGKPDLSKHRRMDANDPKLTSITVPVEVAAGRCMALKVIGPPPGAPGRTRARPH